MEKENNATELLQWLNLDFHILQPPCNVWSHMIMVHYQYSKIFKFGNCNGHKKADRHKLSQKDGQRIVVSPYELHLFLKNITISPMFRLLSQNKSFHQIPRSGYKIPKHRQSPYFPTFLVSTRLFWSTWCLEMRNDISFVSSSHRPSNCAISSCLKQICLVVEWMSRWMSTCCFNTAVGQYQYGGLYTKQYIQLTIIKYIKHHIVTTTFTFTRNLTLAGCHTSLKLTL